MLNPKPAQGGARLAVDVGGTALKGVVVDDSGAVVHQASIATFGVHATPGDALIGLLSDMADKAIGVGLRPTGIGISAPGLIDSANQVVTYAANLGWIDYPVGREVGRRFGLPVAIEHDARAGAIAERAAHADHHERYDDFIFVPIGTGVAAAITTGGRLINGAHGGAGEFGHMQVKPGGEQCACGQLGCLEAYASAVNVVRRYREHGGSDASDARELVEVLARDPIARHVWDDLIDALATGLASLTAVLDPERIVIGGGLSRAGPALFQPLTTELATRLRWRTSPALEQSTLSSHAGLIGAALIAHGTAAPRRRFVQRALHGLNVPDHGEPHPA
ncbi:ROK family protein [Promicromonospora sp. Populi]|uniref:ROK family protein n=1 Tax=Promicromonospora sp. Populi TaxID=3239420 RepID=UPI0034E2A04B